ncbi:MAG: helix-turn-helix domain-containing protein [Rhodoblastus sp.]
MHPADIVAAVKKAGTSLRQLGLSGGFGESTLRAALHKQHPRAQRLIAQTIGKPLHEIWPQWFDVTGAPIRAPRAERTTTRVRESNPRVPSPSKAA